MLKAISDTFVLELEKYEQRLIQIKNFSSEELVRGQLDQVIKDINELTVGATEELRKYE